MDWRTDMLQPLFQARFPQAIFQSSHALWFPACPLTDTVSEGWWPVCQVLHGGKVRATHYLKQWAIHLTKQRVKEKAKVRKSGGGFECITQAKR